MSKDTGGPAFPAFEFQQNYNQMMAVGGMTLRDYFAARAMQGLLAGKLTSTDLRLIANDSYAMADAMLKARTA